MFFITDEGRMLAGQLLEHPRYGRRADSQAFGKRIARHTVILGSAQLEDGLEIVVDGFAACAIFSHA